MEVRSSLGGMDGEGERKEWWGCEEGTEGENGGGMDGWERGGREAVRAGEKS